MGNESYSLALTGSGGSGVMTVGQMVLHAAAQSGWYGLMGRAFGPQIRGGEAAALLRLSINPVQCGDDAYQLLLAFDWGNIERFADEIPLAESSVVLADPAQGEIPEVIARSGARILTVPLTETAKSIDGGRVNMVGLGVVAGVLGLPRAPLEERICAVLSGKGEASQAAALACLTAGLALATDVPDVAHLAEPRQTTEPRWNISGNEAAGLGVLRAGVRFCAAYPITPATDVLEWLAPNLPRVGGALVQAEDELASINMCIGASFGGTPSVTATSGPGLSLMTEALGLAVASETPLVVIDVMRGGPSTGIPTKSEQSDLNIAVYGLHGDAPHLVLAPNGVDDCLFTAQWAVHLAEQLQTPTIVLSDQFMGQARAVLDRPPEAGFKAARVRAEAGEGEYHRYAVTADGISPMAIPGTPNREYTADGLEHNDTGTPSAQAVHHQAQLEKRSRKLRNHDYGESWADVEGDGEIAVITWGSTTQAVREALARARSKGLSARLVSLRLLFPARPEALASALAGVDRVLVVEQSHEQQFLHFLRAWYQLPEEVHTLSRPGPLPLRPGEILAQLDLLAEGVPA